MAQPLKRIMTALAYMAALICTNLLLFAHFGNTVDSSQTTQTYMSNGLNWSSGLRMNQVQVVGTHNSYHNEGPFQEQRVLLEMNPEAKNLFYSHPALDVQAEFQDVRSFELDVYADPEGGRYAEPLIRKKVGEKGGVAALRGKGVKVFHMVDVDYHSTCSTLKTCLGVIKAWSDEHPDHVPVPLMIEFKKTEAMVSEWSGAEAVSWANRTLLKELDDEIRGVFPRERMVVPDDLRRSGMTLEESVLTHGWPDLESARGRVLFFMDNGPVHEVRDAYSEGRPSLEGRIIFTNSRPGQADCAFQKLNDPRGDELDNIREQVKAGYWVRTRADEPLSTLSEKNVTARRDEAFASGAQIVTTDFQAYGMSARWGVDYAVRLGGKTVRCNPVNGGDCEGAKLEG